MQITVKFFARFKELASTQKTTIELPENSTIADLIEVLQSQFSALTLTPEQTLLALNQEFATPENTLSDGDEMAIFPPVSGGSGIEKFAITENVISPEKVGLLVTQPESGAIVTFTGVVRNNSEGNDVSSLTYEAYHDMAVAKIKQVADEAREKFPNIQDIAIVQRIGHLEIGDVAVAIAVSSGHRYDGSFEACQFAIERLKEIVPVWKKEIGPNGETWVEGHHNPSLKS